MYKIYKLVSPNGKVYIGQTSQEKMYNRWKYGNGYNYSKDLYNDILEYGWKNFNHEVIDTAETSEEAHKKERQYILQYESYKKNKGYNKHKNNTSAEKEPKCYIRCVETGELYPSAAEAARAIHKTRQAVSKAVVTQGKCAKLHWEKTWI